MIIIIIQIEPSSSTSSALALNHWLNVDYLVSSSIVLKGSLFEGDPAKRGILGPLSRNPPLCSHRVLLQLLDWAVVLRWSFDGIRWIINNNYGSVIIIIILGKFNFIRAPQHNSYVSR